MAHGSENVNYSLMNNGVLLTMQNCAREDAMHHITPHKHAQTHTYTSTFSTYRVNGTKKTDEVKCLVIYWIN